MDYSLGWIIHVPKSLERGSGLCVHEEQTLVQQSYHFGHHQNTLCISHDRPHKHDTQSDHKDIKT